MKMPLLFVCPSCEKKHYVAYCAANDGGAACGQPFVSTFFPSGRDAQCAKHRAPAKASATAVPEAAGDRCPSTQQRLDLEALQRDPPVDSAPPAANRGSSPRRGSAPSRVMPAPPSRRPAAPIAARPQAPPQPLDEMFPPSEEPAASTEPQNVKCPACFVMFDRSRSAQCPRCGTSADRAPKNVRAAPSKALESLGEQLTFLIVERWKSLAVVLAVVLLGLGALAATASAGWVTAVSLIGFFAFLFTGMGATVVYLRALDTPYYRNQLQARAQRERSSGSFAELKASVQSAFARKPSPAAAPAGPTIPEERSTDLAAALENGSDSSRAPGVTAPGKDEDTHLDLALPAAVAAATLLDQSASVPALYLGGHPEMRGSQRGRLMVGIDGVRFQAKRASISLASSHVDSIRVRRAGHAIAAVLAVAVAVVLLRLLPPSVGTYRLPAWAPWAERMLVGVGIAAKVSWVAAGVLVSLLVLGLVLGRHGSVEVSWRDSEGAHRARFRVRALAAHRLARSVG